MSSAFPLDADIVRSCLLDRPVDAAFAAALEPGGGARDGERSGGALSGVTGHIAESVAELVLDALGYHVIWHFVGPGGHGVDLLVLAPEGDRVVAVEVKGTLRAGRWPRLSRRELAQMSAAWIDKRDNPGMVEWQLDSTDVFGAVVLVNFADNAFRVAFTADFEHLIPVTSLDQLRHLGWLDE